MLSSRLKTISGLVNKIMRFQTNQKASSGQQGGLYDHQMKIIQQKAYLARQIKKTIISPKKKIQELPLKYQVLDVIDQNPSIHEDAKVPFYQLFQDGYQLKKQFTGQKRVQLAAIKNQNATSNTIFHPTKFVTGTIFYNFLSNIDLILFYGHFGISKTFTSILYKILNDFIVDYKIRCSHLSWPAQLGQNIIQSYKVIYWSIDIDKENPDTFQEMLMNQLTQAEKEELRKFGYFDKQNKKLLKDFFQSKGIQIELIIDQINVVISLVRRIGYTRKTTQAEEYVNFQGEKKRRSQIPDYKLLDQIFQSIEWAEQNFIKVTFQSSVNIEDPLFKKLIQTSLRKSKKLQIYKQRFEYISNFKRKISRLQMVDCFLYEFEDFHPVMRTLRDQFGMSKRELHMNLRKQLSQFINEDQFYVTHYSMRKWITQNTFGNNDLENLESMAQLQNYFKQIFQLMLKNSMKDLLATKVKQFLDNSETLKQLKYYFLLQLFILFEKNKLRGLPKQKLIKINKNDIQVVQKKYLEKIQQVLDRHLFKIEGDQIELLIPPNIFFDLKIQNKLLSKQLVETVFSIEAQAILKNVIKKSAMGGTIETMLILELCQGFQDVNIYSSGMKKRKIKSYQSIEQKICTFNALPHADSKLQDYSFNKAMVTGLKTMINNLQSNPKKKEINQIFVPLKVDQDQLQQANAESQLEKSNDTSKAIDFLLVHYQKKNFIVNAFDVAITSDIKVIDEKLQKFLDNYEKIEKKSKFKIDKNQYTMKVNYYVLSNFPHLQEIQQMLWKYEGKIGNIELDKTYNHNIKANHAKKQILGEIGHYSLNSEFKIQSERINHKVNSFSIILSFLESKAQEKEKEAKGKIAKQ